MMDGSKLIIRPALPADAETWAEMFFEIHKEPTAEFGAVTMQAGRETAAHYCRREDTDAGCVLTAFHKGMAVGWIQAQPNDPRIDKRGWYINGVEVRPVFRRQGIARRLVMAFTCGALQNGREVYAAVRKENHPAMHLFGSCLFVPVGNVGSFAENVQVFCRSSTPASA